MPAPISNNREAFLEKHLGKPIQEILRERYIDKKMTMRELAADLGISTNTAMAWMRKYNIPSRKMYFA